MVRNFFLFLLFLMASHALKAQSFTDINAGFPDLEYSTISWVDYDNDNDLDLFLTGVQTSTYIIKQYRNDAGSFVDVPCSLPALYRGSFDWADYDNDNDLDLLMSGGIPTGSISRIYKNNNGVFTDINAGLPGVYDGVSLWGDYDNDGDLDALITGTAGNSGYSGIFRNDNGLFTKTNIFLPSFSGVWCDYDNDGDLDIFFSAGSNSKLYQNNSGNFTNVNSGITAGSVNSDSWGDYDNDGDLDVAVYGSVFKNNNGTFVNINAGFKQLSQGPMTWGDYDNDGDLDILVAGYDGYNGYSYIYQNNNGSFADIHLAGLPNLRHATAEWGDFDNDKDLDFIITGQLDDLSRVTKVFRNNTSLNEIPLAPSTLSSSVTGNTALLNWNKGTDANSPAGFLNYNIRLFGSNGITVSGNSDSVSGYNKMVKIGNAQMARSHTYKHLPIGKYYWQVQSIDNSSQASTYSIKDSFVISTPLPPILIYPQNGQTNLPNTPLMKWSFVQGTTSYEIQISTGFDFVNSLIDKTGITDTVYPVSISLSSNTTYFWRVRSLNAAGYGDWSPTFQLVTGALFTDILANIHGVRGEQRNNNSWGDYDNDGDLDLIVLGDTCFVCNDTINSIARIYRNDAGNFIDIHAGINGMMEGNAIWGDYDNDKDLDVLISGYSGGFSGQGGGGTTKIYKNDNGVFNDLNAGFPVGTVGSFADFDNDGDLDVLLDDKLFKNNNGSFSLFNTFQEYGLTSWGDYDNDGDLDMAVQGVHLNTVIYKNTMGVFTIAVKLPHLAYGSIEWGDYDNDGDLDLLMNGSNSSSQQITKIYRNDNGILTDILASLLGIAGISTWGDYDSDGDLDVLLSGYRDGLGLFTNVYRNDNGLYVDTHINVPGNDFSDGSWGDYDNDGDLDIVISGVESSASLASTKIYRNNGGTNIFQLNTPPTKPTNLSTIITSDSTVIFSWDKSGDNTTKTEALTYNMVISVYSSPGVGLPSMSDSASGHRKIVDFGNIGLKNSHTIKNLPPNKYNWGIQSVDNSFSASAFSFDTISIKPYAEFTIPDTACQAASVELTYKGNATNSGVYNWDLDGGVIVSGTGGGPLTVQWASSGLKSIKLSVSENNLYSSVVEKKIYIRVSNQASVSISVDANPVCSGVNSVFTANPVNGGSKPSYKWKRNGVSSGANLSTYTNSLVNGDQISVVLTSSLTCGNVVPAVSNTITMTVASPPLASITPAGPTTFCPGDSVLLNASTGTGYAYQWKRGGVAISGATLPSYVAKLSGSYTVDVMAGCTKTSSAVNVSATLPSATIFYSGVASICTGDSIRFTTNSGSGYIYEWMLDGVTVAGANAVVYYAKVAGNYSVKTTYSSGCSNTSASVYLSNFPSPSAFITPAGSTTICSGSSVILNASTGAGNTYQWKRGGSIIPGATSFSYPANAAGSYTVDVINGCTKTSLPVNVVVAVPAAVISPSGSVSVCSGDSIKFSVGVVAGYNYQWMKNGADIGGANAVDYYAKTAGSYSVKATDTNGCTNTSTSTLLALNNFPPANITPQSSLRFCPGGAVILNSNTGSGYSYQWKINGVVIPGATSSSYWTDSSGSYTVDVIAACTSTSPAVNVIVAVPDATISPSGSVSICPYDSIKFMANAGTGYTYQWMLFGKPIQAANAGSYYANQEGPYTVKVTDSYGCTNTSAPVSLARVGIAYVDIAPDGPVNFCTGGMVTLYTAPGGTGLTYQWKNSGVDIAGVTSNAYTATSSGSYALEITSWNGCTRTSNTINVGGGPTQADAGADQSISTTATFFQGNNPVSGTGQWSIISGSGNISNIHDPASPVTGLASGINEFQWTISSGSCTPSSDNVIIYVGPASVTNFNTNQISCFLYPNPFNEHTILRVNNLSNAEFVLSILDVFGNPVLSYKELLPNTDIELGNKLGPGVYFVHVFHEGQNIIFKMVKL